MVIKWSPPCINLVRELLAMVRGRLVTGEARGLATALKALLPLLQQGAETSVRSKGSLSSILLGKAAVCSATGIFAIMVCRLSNNNIVGLIICHWVQSKSTCSTTM